MTLSTSSAYQRKEGKKEGSKREIKLCLTTLTCPNSALWGTVSFLVLVPALFLQKTENFFLSHLPSLPSISLSASCTPRKQPSWSAVSLVPMDSLAPSSLLPDRYLANYRVITQSTKSFQTNTRLTYCLS